MGRGIDGEDRPRSTVRVSAGPILGTSGVGVGSGVLAAIDVGEKSLAGRFYGAWLKGEPGEGSKLREGLSHYGAELVLTLNRDGMVRPVVGLGMAYARASDVGGTSQVGVGTARAGVEVRLPVDDVDARVSASVLGALVGPAERPARDLGGYGVGALVMTFGF